MHQEIMAQALRLAAENVPTGRGGPFAAIVVRDGAIVASGVNLVTSAIDPTAHAEITAIRRACASLGTFQLEGCSLYSSCEPCPMCLGAIYWARLDRVYFAATQEDAAAAGFDDSDIYGEIRARLEARRLPMENVMREEGREPFRVWVDCQKKIPY